MLNVPIHKPHRQKNYRSSTGKSTGGETLQLDVLRAVQTHIFKLLQTQKSGWQSCRYCILANKTKMNGLSGTQTGELAWEQLVIFIHIKLFIPNKAFKHLFHVFSRYESTYCA